MSTAMGTTAGMCAGSRTRLSPRQLRFVEHYCVHLNASRAARESGYSAASGADAVSGCRLLGLTKIRAAIQARQQAHAVELGLRRQDVIAAILDAIHTARTQAEPATMLAGWVQIGKMLGHYAPETATKPVSSVTTALQAKLNSMDDAALLALSQGRHP